MALGEKSLFWDKPDEVLTPEELEYYQYSGQDLASYFECMYTTGIAPQMAVSNNADNPQEYIGSSLAVSAGNGLQVVVSPGTAMIKGRPYLLSLPLTFDLADGAITDILLQLNAQQAQPEIKLIARKRPTGLSLVENIKHESLIYEISIASVDVPASSIQINPTMITDQRLNMTLHNTDNKPVAGLCQSIPQVNTLGIWEDYQKLDTYIKGVWRAFITDSTNEWATFLATKRSDFDEWFTTIKDILSDDVAGNLAAEIAKLKQRANTLETKLDTHTTNQTSHVQTLTHIKTGTVHKLTGTLPSTGLVTANFTAKANYIKNDTITVNGVNYAVQDVLGKQVSGFVAGAGVTATINIDTKIITVLDKTTDAETCGGYTSDYFIPHISSRSPSSYLGQNKQWQVYG